MNKYEAMFIIKSDLNEANKKTLLNQIQDAINKNEGKVVSSSLWAEKKRLSFPIKKIKEADYFLVNFQSSPSKIKPIKEAYRLNENILRMLVLKDE